MHSLRLGLRRRLVNALVPRRTITPMPFEVPHHAGKYRGDLANAQDWHVYFFSGYELKELALITDLLKSMPGAVALDIGGNQGGHTLTMAQVADQVHSVEPFPPLADRVEELMGLNGKDNVTVHRVGLGEEAGNLDYFLDTEASNQGTGSFLADHTESEVAAKLPVVRGDDYFADRLHKLTFLKIDIEGFEAPALAGLRETLAKYKPIIMMEVTGTSANNFEARGGIENVLPFEHQVFEVKNPDYVAGLLQFKNYRLERLDDYAPRPASYNVLIVPEARARDLRASGADRTIGLPLE